MPTIYSLNQHGIPLNAIDPDALFVLRRLQEASFIAYIVGGAVRDLLFQEQPKDYDIATSALPEQVKKLFRSCLLIGRRFRLAHVRFGPKILEVATFRSGDSEDEDLIVRDNEWGTPEQDVLRRDFTINGLFYDAATETVIDYVGGYHDIQRQLLRTIGNPILRFKQDPVRMIRLLKFKARLGCHLDPNTLHALIEHRDEITKSSPARVLEEFLKMLESRHSEAFFQLMTETELLAPLFPALFRFLQGSHSSNVLDYLKTADLLVLKTPNYKFSREALFCSLLFPRLELRIYSEYLGKNTVPSVGALSIMISELLDHTLDCFPHFPRRLKSAIEYILHQQYRFTPLQPRSKRTLRVSRTHEFFFSLQFLQIRAELDPRLHRSYTEWLHAFKQETGSGL
jgi:poly(A) polymerase